MAHDAKDPADVSDSSPGVVVYRMATAYQATEVVYAAAKLGLADLLSSGPRSSAELADRASAHAPSLLRLLRALAAFGVVDEPEPDRFILTPIGECLRADSPDSVRALVLMFGSEYFRQIWGDLEHVVRTGEPAPRHLFGAAGTSYLRDHPDVLATVIAGLTGLSTAVGKAVVAAYPFARQGTVVDIGGGEGQLLAMLLRARPQLRGVLFDQPHVVAGAPAVFEAAGVAARCKSVGGDFFQSVPEGGDLYMMSRVIHDWDDERATEILGNVRHAMGDQAKLLLIERVLPSVPSCTSDAQSRLLSDLNMLVTTPNGGRERTAEEYRAILAPVGLRLTTVTDTRAPISIVEAVPA